MESFVRLYLWDLPNTYKLRGEKKGILRQSEVLLELLPTGSVRYHWLQAPRLLKDELVPQWYPPHEKIQNKRMINIRFLAIISGCQAIQPRQFNGIRAFGAIFFIVLRKFKNTKTI